MKTSVHNFVFFTFLLFGAAQAAEPAANFDATTETVGRTANGLETPVNQVVTPAGTQIELPHMRPNALALSPDGKLLVTSGLTNKLVVIDPAAGKISQVVAFPPDKVQADAPAADENLSTSKKAQLSFTGLAFSPDGSRIYCRTSTAT